MMTATRNEGAPAGALAGAHDGGCEARTSVSGRYPDPTPAATARLVTYTSVRLDVFGRRDVRAIVLPVRAGEIPPGPTVTYRGHTWTCVGEQPAPSTTPHS